MGKVVYLDGFGENPPGRRILEGTDLEIACRLEGDDLVVQVNKGPVQVCRVRLKDARKPMSDAELMKFSGVAPDFTFRIGENRERVWRLAQGLGLDEAQLAKLKARLFGADVNRGLD